MVIASFWQWSSVLDCRLILRISEAKLSVIWSTALVVWRQNLFTLPIFPTVFGKYGTPPHLGWWVNPVRGFALTLAPSCGTQWSGAWKRKTLRAPTANSLLGLGTWSLHSPLKQQPLRGYVPTGKATHEAGTCEAWTGQPLATVEKARLPNVSFLLRRHIRNR